MFDNFANWDAPMLKGGDPASMQRLGDAMQDADRRDVARRLGVRRKVVVGVVKHGVRRVAEARLDVRSRRLGGRRRHDLEVGVRIGVRVRVRLVVLRLLLAALHDRAHLLGHAGTAAALGEMVDDGVGA